jgi:hypothetical protein
MKLIAFRNIAQYSLVEVFLLVLNYTVLCPRRLPYSYLQPSEPEISQLCYV